LNTWPVAALQHAVKPDNWLRIAISAYPTCIRRPQYGDSRRNIAMTFGMKKLEWLGYPIVKKFEDMFICFDRIHERDGHTDGRTDNA